MLSIMAKLIVLSLQMKQGTGNIFVSQTKHMKAFLRNFSIQGLSPKLPPNKSKKMNMLKVVDQKLFQCVIGSLFYLTNI